MIRRLVFATALQGAALGAVLTFATHPLYPSHVAGALAFGVRPLADQRLAGLIMWVPMGAVYLVTMACLFAGWMKEMDRRADRGVVMGTGDAL